MTLQEIKDLIDVELDHAKNKWPEWPDDLVYAASIVSEEAGELVKEANDYTWHQKHHYKMYMILEAVQTAAMAIRFLENIK